MAVDSASINITRIAGTDRFNFALLINPTAATGGSAMTDAVTSANGMKAGMQKAQESLYNICQSANWS